MIEFGINDAATVGMDAAGCYGVELCRVSLPHMPIPQAVFNQLKLSKHELPCHMQIKGKVHRAPAFKLVSIVSLLQEGKQIVRGKIRSVGVGINFATHLKMDRPEQLKFQILCGLAGSSTVRDATDIISIHGFALVVD